MAANLSSILNTSIRPALELLPASMTSNPAMVQLLAIGLQESRFEYRRQIGNGPARGLWQFEKGGGVKGVMTHERTFSHAHSICKARGVQFTPAQIWNALERDDVLAAGFARLLLWSDPVSMPTTSRAAWDVYERNWRPGKPHPGTWSTYYGMAQQAVMG